MPTPLILFRATRPAFLVHSVILGALGAAMAWAAGPISQFHALLCLAGVVLLHISTNVLNDYFDYRSGIDLATQATPFNGGSRFIHQGLMTRGATLAFGLAALGLALPIGAYFVFWVDLKLLALFFPGAFLVVFGTSYLTRFGFGAGEAAAGLGLGMLPVVGIYWILHGHIDARVVYASIPSGLLASNLLLLNEFPDSEADRLGGRKTLPISLGAKKAATLYALVALLVFVWIMAGVLLGLMPLPAILALAALPTALKAVRRTLLYAASEPERLLKAQEANVKVDLLVQALLALGYFVDAMV